MSWITLVQQIFGWNYYEVKAFLSSTRTVTTTPTSLTGTTNFYVLSYLIRVRSMGTATYIALGDSQARNFRLTTVGETFGFYGNPREVFDLSSVYVVSDTSDAVIELYVLYKEGSEARIDAVDP
jgi:hypothetical protein